VRFHASLNVEEIFWVSADTRLELRVKVNSLNLALSYHLSRVWYRRGYRH
jgi:hypothetical protein